MLPSAQAVPAPCHSWLLAQLLALFLDQCPRWGAAQLGLWQLLLHPTPLTPSTQLSWPSAAPSSCSPGPGSSCSLLPTPPGKVPWQVSSPAAALFRPWKPRAQQALSLKGASPTSLCPDSPSHDQLGTSPAPGTLSVVPHGQGPSSLSPHHAMWSLPDAHRHGQTRALAACAGSAPRRCIPRSFTPGSCIPRSCIPKSWVQGHGAHGEHSRHRCYSSSAKGSEYSAQK